jgi:cobalt-zinc-cadmium efflux system protein
MHVHAHEGPEMRRALGWALWVNLAFVVLEFIAGYLANSLALISDAVHNLSDLPAMGLSLFALYAQQLPADRRRTYGYQRSGVLAAFVNGLILIAVAGYIFYEAYHRFRHPVPVGTTLMIWVSLIGIAVNGGIAWAMWRGRRDVNLRTVLIHNAGDAGSNVGILVGAVLIAQTGWLILDPVISFAIGLAILWTTWGVLKETTNILLEGSPREVKVEEVARAMLQVPGMVEVHDIHVWSLAAQHHALSCHVRVGDMSTRDSERILEQLKALLDEKFSISHTTIQVESAPEAAQLHPLPEARNDS